MQITRVKKIFFGLFCLPLFLVAQQNTISPYSVFGIGELQNQGFTLNNSLGGLGVALRSKSFLNPTNPASLSGLSLTTYEAGISATSMFLTEGNLNQEFFSGTLSYLSLGFPISEGFGASAGVLPFSFQGYKLMQSFDTESVNEATTYDVNHSGSGGIHRAYINLGLELFDGFSLGATGSSVFGRLKRQRDVVYFQDDYLNRRDENTYTVRDFVIDFGAQYQLSVKEKTVVLGASFQPQSNLKADAIDLTYTYNVLGDFEYIRDTISSFSSSSSGLILPKSLVVGASFSEENHWLVSAELDFKEWSELKLFEQTDPQLRNATQYKVGFWWIPNQGNIHNYLSNIQYRGGVNYNTGFLSVSAFGESISPTEINDLSLSLGLGLPLKKSKSTLNIGVQFGRRGSLGEGLVEERYIKFQLALTFNDKWFTKRKID
jgi:hypothetical protein